MTIDLGKEFERMAKDFGINDKEVLSSVRTMIRSTWGDSIFKTEFLKSNSVLIKNTNTRSMKRFPMVRKYQCAICKEYFSGTEVELDHLDSENALTEYEHINDFFKTIVLTSPDKLQVLCKDKKTKKLGVTRFGCHNIKTYQERYNVSFEQALAEKKAIKLIKDKVDKQFLIDHNVTPESKQARRRQQIVEVLMKEKEDAL